MEGVLEIILMVLFKLMGLIVFLMWDMVFKIMGEEFLLMKEVLFLD